MNTDNQQELVKKDNKADSSDKEKDAAKNAGKKMSDEKEQAKNENSLQQGESD